MEQLLVPPAVTSIPATPRPEPPQVSGPAVDVAPPSASSAYGPVAAQTSAEDTIAKAATAPYSTQ
eukprot:7376063-Karenia_brevis.AAC.1